MSPHLSQSQTWMRSGRKQIYYPGIFQDVTLTTEPKSTNWLYTSLLSCNRITDMTQHQTNQIGKKKKLLNSKPSSDSNTPGSVSFSYYQMRGDEEEQLQTNKWRFLYLFKQPKTIGGNKRSWNKLFSHWHVFSYIVLALHSHFSSGRLFYSCFQVSYKALQCQTSSDWVLTMTVN